MKENDVAYISKQFNLEKEIVEASVNDGTLGQRIEDSLKNKIIYSKDEFEKFKNNLSAEAQTKYHNELVEKANKGEIPNDLHKPIKGAALQQLERDLSKEYEVTDYANIRDLISKVIHKTSANGKPNTELEKQVADLKSVNVRLTQEKEDALKTIEQKYKSQIIEREKLDAIKKIPFDFNDVKADELEKVRNKTQTILKSVFDVDYKLDYDNDILVVKDKTGNIRKNGATLEPVSVSEVMTELAKEYNLKLMSPDSGGQGGQSSTKSSALFSDIDGYDKYCKANNLNPMSREALAEWRKMQQTSK